FGGLFYGPNSQSRRTISAGDQLLFGYYACMAWDDGLVGTARDIAATDRTPLRVMAGPGTGKSFVMKRRAARLLESGQDPRRILAVTFTRNAAASLVNDLRDLG